MARIELVCPNCQHVFFVSPDDQGDVVECPECEGWVDAPVLTRKPTTAESAEEDWNRRAQDEWERQNERMRELLERDLFNTTKHGEILMQAESLLSRWSGLADRMAAVLDRLERQ